MTSSSFVRTTKHEPQKLCLPDNFLSALSLPLGGVHVHSSHATEANGEASTAGPIEQAQGRAYGSDLDKDMAQMLNSILGLWIAEIVLLQQSLRPPLDVNASTSLSRDAELRCRLWQY